MKSSAPLSDDIAQGSLDSRTLKALKKIVGETHVSTSAVDRATYSRDANFKQTIQWRRGRLGVRPGAIVWPVGAEQVAQVLKVAQREGIPVVPYGAGSGVCAGALPLPGCITLDLKRNNRILKIDTATQTVRVETGMMGQILQEQLEGQGWTLGHFPSSIYCSTVGGWLAARSAGQFSTRYGKIEDMVRSLTVVLPEGEILKTRFMGNRPGGLDFNELFVGSEGVLGVITEATLKIHPLPLRQFFSGYSLANFSLALEAVQRLLQAGIQPAVVRLYDPLDSLLFLSGMKETALFKGLGVDRLMASRLASLVEQLTGRATRLVLSLPRLTHFVTQKIPHGVLLILGHEGHRHLVEAEKDIARRILMTLGGEALGEAPGRHWLKHRYSAAYKMSPIFASGAFADTMEVAATWDELESLYEDILATLGRHALAMAHLSHVYPEGGALYFTFVAYAGSDRKNEALYDKIWDEILQVASSHKGAISHHHGIGRLKKKYLAHEWGAGMEMVSAIKHLLDPRHILNPDKLL